MDLRSIINNEGGEGSISKQHAPAAPLHAPPQQAFRDYSHPPQASPGKHPSQDYGSQAGGPYASPTTYQGNYQGRPPQPPPIQAPPQNDLRSPSRSYSAQSPYQHTPSSSISAGQYPFPQSHQTPQSPAQHQQYPPSFSQRDSYPQSNPPPHLQHQNSHSQGSPAPQTPPIGIPGAPHPYLQHQRSHSSVSTSTPTPTSAQSQQQYYNQFPQDSPVSTGHFPPQIPQHQRQQSQQSQPGTPLGPPLNQRPVSGGFAQPTSPYQQRGHSGPFSHYQQTSPAPPAPASIPRLPSTPDAYDSQRTSLSEQQRRSQSERERSLSVSPKTRLPSQPRGDIHQILQPENGYNSSKRKMDDRQESVEGLHPSKRKMEDREIPVEEPRRINDTEVKPQANGDRQISKELTMSPQQPPKKRFRYTEPPIWARSVRSKNAQVGNRGPSKVNGKQPAPGFPSQAAPSPLIKTEVNGDRHAAPAAVNAGPGANAGEPDPSLILGPWERSITGQKPVETMTRLAADFLFSNVVARGDLGELASRGVLIEIEAKLGQLIDKGTNVRYWQPIMSECVVETGRYMFRSSMTEYQHKKLNDFLNAQVAATHPQNREQTKKRVQIDYKHRREVDKFYELPPSMYNSLPAAVREHLNPRHTVKVRVTHDQKTNQVLAKIIKVRLIDFDVHMPNTPLDCRISIAFELEYDGDVGDIVGEATEQKYPDRSKDRLSYTQGPYQIDLTQVTQATSVNGQYRTEKEHELEIEVATPAVREQGQRAMSGQPNEYLALVEGFVDNVRVLARAVPPPQ